MNYKVFAYSDPRRPYYVVRWWNGPPGLEQGERSTKQKSRRKATEWAADFIASIEAGRVVGDAITWKAFRDRLTAEMLPELKSPGPYNSTLNNFERLIGKPKIADIDAPMFAEFKIALARSGCKPSSQASYAKHLRSMLGWAERAGLLHHAPAVKTGQTDAMRGRPLTVEEYERMRDAVPKVVGKKWAPEWRAVLAGAWSIGLRRSEFFRVSWDRDDRIQLLGLSAGTPRIMFPADQHKAKRDMLLPLLPEAVADLQEIPKSKRKGSVYQPLRGIRKLVTTADSLGRCVALIGQTAGVVTGADPETGEKQFATLHDLRRSLGTRLAHRPDLSIPEVAMLMRHRKIDTTMAHYAELQIGPLAEKLATKSGCTSGCTTDGDHQNEPRRKSLNRS